MEKIEISVSLLSRVCGNQFSSFYKHLSLRDLKGAPEIVLLLFFVYFWMIMYSILLTLTLLP